MHLTPRKALFFLLAATICYFIHVTLLDDRRGAVETLLHIKSHQALDTSIFSPGSSRGSTRGFKDFFTSNNKHRYESTEKWRDDDTFEPAYIASQNRPHMPSFEKFKSRGEYLKQPLIADSAYNSDKVFLMIKTGGSELWDKLPIHLLTTLTRVTHFALYSDSPGSVAGYEVIDILANVSKDTKEELIEFDKTYRVQNFIHDQHGIYDDSDMEETYAWDLDRFKNIPMLQHAYNVAPPQVDWFVLIDADSYLFMDNLMRWLDQFDPQDPWYLGCPIPGNPIYFVHGGSGIVLSRKAVDNTLGQSPELISKYEELTKGSCCGDMMLGLMMIQEGNLNGSSGYNLNETFEVQYELANRPDSRQVSFQGNAIWDIQVTQQNWCLPLISFHHMTPHDIERVYEYERLLVAPEKKGNITYGDIFMDFYEPYISNKLTDWDNNARDFVFSLQRDIDRNIPIGVDPRPYDSAEACQRTCNYYKGCLAYRFLPHDQYCGLGFSVRLGHPVVGDNFVFTYDHDLGVVRNNTDAVSGWMVDRISEDLQSQSC